MGLPSARQKGKAGRPSSPSVGSAPVQVLAPYAPIVEVGAGSGYWAYELRQAGVEVVATDPGTGRYHRLNHWVCPTFYTAVCHDCEPLLPTC
jgi:hypothetical protein